MQDDNCHESGSNQLRYQEDELLQKLEKINRQLEKANASPLMQSAPPSLVKLALLQLFKGIFLGLGSFLGAGLVVSLLVYLLSTIEFIPIIGDVINKILQELHR